MTNDSTATTNHLIILPCHSVWKHGGATLGESRDEWHLVGFQIEGYDHLSMKQHILVSLTELSQDPRAHLVISGGETKREAGPVSESLSYYLLARELCDDEELVLQRVSTESFARDSFENVVFLICRFYEVFGTYPEKITIVGFEFKRRRFLDLHLETALLFPRENVVYIGNAPDPKDIRVEEEKEKYFREIDENEHRFAVKLFEQDWYGVNGGLLKKKLARNPFNRYHGYAQSNPDLAEFLVAIQDHSESNDNEQIRNLLLHMPWIDRK
ncbi:hypothetical protein Cantr_08527 [Candida viswanathii]|uniref:DUF218 domain-containing protein n=1 Tax=Candida viswanathii TaxID=5486 RepID=A0A367Y6W3_9ASCO|nr:hypothetical protein Cantr_08527 [Candida viswanathii]